MHDNPEESRTLKWIKQASWDRLPDDVAYELGIWLAMPGFAPTWHRHHLRAGLPRIKQHWGRYDQFRAEVAENWLSATREDCVKLSQMRPGTTTIPLISQMRAMTDLKAMTQADVMRDYRTVYPTIGGWLRRGFVYAGYPVPPGFEYLLKSVPI